MRMSSILRREGSILEIKNKKRSINSKFQNLKQSKEGHEKLPQKSERKLLCSLARSKNLSIPSLMEEKQSTNSHHEFPETPISCSVLGPEKHPKQLDYGDDNDDDESTISALCVPGSRLVRTGFVHSTCSGL